MYERSQIKEWLNSGGKEGGYLNISTKNAFENKLIHQYVEQE